MPETRAIRRKKPTQERARESRDRIIDSAAHLFAERGIADTSTNRIAAHANMSIGTLYRYFTDKGEIVEILRVRLLAELEERFTEAVLRGIGLSPRDSVAASLHAIVSVLADREPLVRALTAEATVAGSGFGGLERRLFFLTRAYLLQHLGPIPDDELDTRAFVMVNAGLAAALRIGLKPPPDLDRDRLIDETANMIGAWLA